MRTSLTTSSKGLYQWRDRRIRVHDDAYTALLLIELFADKLLMPEEKLEVLVVRLFVDPEKVIGAIGEDLGDLLSDCLWDLFGLDVSGKRPHEEPVFDFEQDAARIKASFLSDYGLNFDEIKHSITYGEFLDLLGELGPKTPFGQAVAYRTCKTPATTKYNREEVERIRTLKRHYKLNRRGEGPAIPTDGMMAQQCAMEDLFSGLARKAGSRG